VALVEVLPALTLPGNHQRFLRRIGADRLRGAGKRAGQIAEKLIAVAPRVCNELVTRCGFSFQGLASFPQILVSNDALSATGSIN
jgi:hypothetical protein